MLREHKQCPQAHTYQEKEPGLSQACLLSEPLLLTTRHHISLQIRNRLGKWAKGNRMEFKWNECMVQDISYNNNNNNGGKRTPAERSKVLLGGRTSGVARRPEGRLRRKRWFGTRSYA